MIKGREGGREEAAWDDVSVSSGWDFYSRSKKAHLNGFANAQVVLLVSRLCAFALTLFVVR